MRMAMELRDSHYINTHNGLALLDLMEYLYASTLYKRQFAKLTGMGSGIPSWDVMRFRNNKLEPTEKYFKSFII